MNSQRTTYTPLIGVFTIVLLLLASAVAGAISPVRIIFDTDFGDDGDDLAALAVLHHLA